MKLQVVSPKQLSQMIDSEAGKDSDVQADLSVPSWHMMYFLILLQVPC